jgi:hypothetical protein
MYRFERAQVAACGLDVAEFQLAIVAEIAVTMPAMRSSLAAAWQNEGTSRCLVI